MMKRVVTLMLAAMLLLGLTACGSKGITAKDGLGEGQLGDVMKSYFFDFTVNSVSVADTYETYVPAEGNQVLIANVTVKNTRDSSIEMYDSDFWLEWSPQTEDSYAWPITGDDEGNEIVEANVSDNQLPYIYRLASKEERTGDLVFEVPAGTSPELASIWYLEMFDDGTAEGSTGDYYAVYLTEKSK